MTGAVPGAAMHPLAQVLDEGRLRLGATESPLQEARRLLEHAAGLARGQVHRLDPADLTPALLDRYRGLLERRAGGEPLSKILGWRDFWNHRFRVTRDVLDPRPDTETLVAAALAAPFARLLDLGTGSGCILLSLLAERTGATGLGTDLSPPALGVARANARAMGLDGRAGFALSDWFAAVTGRFDLIVANPPYIAAGEMAGLAPELAHDPRMALTDEGDGLGAYRAIVPAAGRHLLPGGWLVVEIGWRQAAAVSGLFREAGFEQVTILPDIARRDRAVRGLWPG